MCLPPGYGAEGRRRYPVLYMHDGQNIMGDTSPVGAAWRVDRTAAELVALGAVEPLIVVGVYHAGTGRIHEYAPTFDERRGEGGQAALYGRMLVEELKPFIDRTYRTRADAPNTGLGGSSLGGLVSLHLGLRHPDVFGKLAVMSPSVWWDRRMILREASALPAKLPLRIWLSVGTAEARGAALDVRRLRDILVAKGWTPGVDLEYVEAKGAPHNEEAWAALVGPMLRFLFGSRERGVGSP